MHATQREPASRLYTAALALCAAGALSSLLQWARVRHALNAGLDAQVLHCPGRQVVQTPSARFLLIGDSAALGVGAAQPQHALAGLIASGFRSAHVHTLAESGATLDGVRAQLRSARSDYHVAILVAGGNDILSRRRRKDIAADAEALMAGLRNRAAVVVWLGVANMGLAPLFVPPWSWWVSARVRRLRRIFDVAAKRHGARYIDFYREAGDDVFSRDPLRYFAADGIHPSSATYRHCFEAMRTALLERCSSIQGVS